MEDVRGSALSTAVRARGRNQDCCVRPTRRLERGSWIGTSCPVGPCILVPSIIIHVVRLQCYRSSADVSDRKVHYAAIRERPVFQTDRLRSYFLGSRNRAEQTRRVGVDHHGSDYDNEDHENLSDDRVDAPLVPEEAS